MIIVEHNDIQKEILGISGGDICAASLKEGFAILGKDRENIPKTSVALGLFDALHIGHMRIIGAAAKYAKNSGGILAVQLIVMSEESGFECINTLKRRISILRDYGVEAVFIEKFTAEFRSVTYKSFVSDFLSDRYNAAAVSAGFNYTFGCGAEGNTDRLCEECRKYNIDVFIEPRVALENTVSSSHIRELIRLGDVETAARYMGRQFSVSGVVIGGRHLGRTLDFPTANIDMPKGVVMPKEGVYKTKVFIENKWFYAITNVGAKPTVGDLTSNIETNIINFSGDLYGREIEVFFCRRLRDIRQFGGVDELKAQLRLDTAEAQREEE